MTLKQMLIDYAKDVINSPETNCEKYRWACQRFLRDVERENTDDFLYIFDEEKAIRFLEWMTCFTHSKGPLAGKPIEPAPIQMFIFSQLYGWVNRDTKRRRFRKLYWQVGRKNAKTQSLACVSSYEASAFGEPYSEVYIAATKREQAEILWNEVEIQIKNSEFAKSFKTAYKQISHSKSGSFIKALSKDSGKTGDGFNPQFGAVDEYHAHPTAEIYEVLESGQGARDQPLIGIITTAGFNLTYPCYLQEYSYASRLLNPDDDTENDEVLCIINELDKNDDIKNENNWIKANPILASHETGISYLRSRLRTALDVPEKMRDFLTKNMNVWVDAPDSAYIEIDKWDKCKVSLEELENNLKNTDCYIGVDLSLTTDLTAIGLVGKNNDKTYVKVIGFIPENKYQERMAVDKVPYDVYVREGYLILTEGSVVDYHLVQSYIEKWCKEYRVKEICFDRYQATNMMMNLNNEGYTVVEIPQSFAFLSEPTKEFRAQTFNQLIGHDGNRLLRRALMNAMTRVDDMENIMLSKKKSVGRIDPIAALMNAFSRQMANANAVDLDEYYSSIDFSF